MFGLLVLLFTVVPAVEIFLLFEIGSKIGAGNTMLIILVTGVLGASLAKSQGLSILMKIQNEVNQGSLPGNQIIQGLMVFAGGILLLTPGFATDIFGFSLVLPGSRHLLMFWVKKMIDHAMKNGNINFQSFGTKSGGGFSSHTSNQTESMNGLFEEELNPHNKTSEIDGDIIEAEYTKKD